MASKLTFLFVLIAALRVQAQVLSPLSNCLGNCTNCQSLSLTQCGGSAPCQWGFYDPVGTGNCQQTPSTRTVSAELGQRVNNSDRAVAVGWSSNAKQSLCQYPSSQGLKFIDVLGFYSGVEMLEKSFKLGVDSQVFELSFNLLHDEWLPFNDFLIVDLSSNSYNIETFEISYDNRVLIADEAVQIACEGRKVVSRKYSIKFYRSKLLTGPLTIIFTSFLFNTVWAISNIKLVEGCTGYSMFNPQNKKCDRCDPDSFLVKFGQSEWCQKCPSLCKTCSSAKKCLSCVKGATLNAQSICSFGAGFKTQLIPMLASKTSCEGSAVLVGSLLNPIKLDSIKNENSQLYDEVQIGFSLLYFPLEWQPGSKNWISVKLNGNEVLKLDSRNLTNQGTTGCSAFVNDMAKIQIFSDKLVLADNVVNLQFTVSADANVQVGISDAIVKSIIKAVQTPQISPIAIKPATPSPEPTSIIQPSIITPLSTKASNVTIGPNTTAQASILPNSSLPSKNSQGNSPNIIVNNSSIPSVSPNISTPFVNSTISNPVSPNISVPFVNSSSSTTSVSPTVSIPSEVPGGAVVPDTSVVPVVGSIGFLPTVSAKKCGIELFITNQPQQGRYLYEARIDKLSAQQYAVDSYYLQDGKLNMFIRVDSSFTNGKVSVYRTPVSRLLQNSNNNNPILAGEFAVRRFDSLNVQQISSIEGFSVVFTVAAWIGVVMMLLSVLSGCGVVMEQYILALQVIFLHVYIAADYIPLTFRDTVGGLNLIENLNFFMPSHAQSIQDEWMGNVVQNGPVRFCLFNTDINFLREFYPIIIVNLIYLIWFGLVLVARHLLNRNLIEEEKGVLHRWLDSIGNRKINFAEQIWRHQFLATLWACFVQFYNLSYPNGSNRSPAINAIICILAFICSLAWPVFLTFFTRRQYYQRQYSQFLYFYEDLYFMKIPQFQLPSSHHRTGYPIFRTCKVFLIVLCVCYFGNTASLVLVVLVLVHLLELVYLRLQDISNRRGYFLFRVIQNCIFILVDLVLLGLLNFSSLAVSESYVYLGFILAGICLLIVINAGVRVIYLCRHKYLGAIQGEEELMVEEKKPKTERVV